MADKKEVVVTGRMDFSGRGVAGSDHRKIYSLMIRRTAKRTFTHNKEVKIDGKTVYIPMFQMIK